MCRRSVLSLLAVWVTLVALVPTASAGVMDPASCIDPGWRDRALGVLRGALVTQSGWVRIHAAEALLALDQPQGVCEAFADELKSRGEEPQYRIGLWRVMAQAAYDPEEAEPWLAKIRGALSASDRLHATETLAKLGWAPTRDELKSVGEAAADADPALAAYAQWLLANTGLAAEQRKLVQLLTATDATSRSLAAYALRFSKELPASTVRALVEAARQEPAGSPARVYLLSAAFCHTTAPADVAWLRDALLACAAEPDKDVRYEVACALARRGKVDDLGLLARLLDDPEADVRVAAANAILHLGRRGTAHMAALDWAAIALYALGMLAVGFYFMRRSKTAEDYLLGGRTMQSWAVGLSLFATLFSTISYLAVPGEIVKHGPMIVCAVVAYPFIVLVVGWLLIPYIMRLRVMSAYEILEVRLGGSVRLLGAGLFLALRLLWMATIIYATTDKVLMPLLGLPSSATPAVCAVLGLVTLIYTAMGGIRAVIWTDVLQTVILFAAAATVVTMTTLDLGGVGAWWPHAWPANWETPRFGFQTGGRMTLGWIVLSTFFWYVCTCGSDQIAIQRYLSTRDVKAARRVVIWSVCCDVLVTLFLGALGLSLLAYFRAHPEMLADGQRIVANADQLLPRFIVFAMPAGLSGLVIAGLLAAAMSSLSSGVNSASSVITVDFIDRFRQRRLTESGHVRLAVVVSVGVGIVVVATSLYVSVVPGNLLEVAYRVVNLLVAPLFVLFAMAMFVPWATTFGTWVGDLAAIAVAVGIAYWEVLTGLKGPSFLWIMPASLLVGIVVGMLASLLPVGAKAKKTLAELVQAPSPEEPMGEP